MLPLRTPKLARVRLPIAFCRFKSSEQARQVELKMNGKKWSELGFKFFDMDEDKTMTVKKANKQTKLDKRVFNMAPMPPPPPPLPLAPDFERSPAPAKRAVRFLLLLGESTSLFS